MGKLAFSPAQLALCLGIGLVLSFVVLVYSVVRIRKRWREGQKALQELHQSARDFRLEMQQPEGAATSAAESEATSE